MNKIIAVSQCLKLEYNDQTSIWKYYFHFVGWYRGEKIKRIVVHSPMPLKFEKHNEYVLLIAMLKIKRSDIHSKIIKYKPFSELIYL